MLTHAARQFVLMQRFFHNPKRQRGILLRSPLSEIHFVAQFSVMGENANHRSEWLAARSLADASGCDSAAKTPRAGIKKRGREPACSRMRLASLF